MNDRIMITGIEAHGFHGVFPEEKRDGQIFIADATLELLSSAASESDKLEDAVDYSKVAVRIHEILVGPSFDLIERVAGVIAQALINEYPLATVEITIHKPNAPIGLPFKDVSVTVKRSR